MAPNKVNNNREDINLILEELEEWSGDVENSTTSDRRINHFFIPSSLPAYLWQVMLEQSHHVELLLLYSFSAVESRYLYLLWTKITYLCGKFHATLISNRY